MYFVFQKHPELERRFISIYEDLLNSFKLFIEKIKNSLNPEDAKLKNSFGHMEIGKIVPPSVIKSVNSTWANDVVKGATSERQMAWLIVVNDGIELFIGSLKPEQAEKYAQQITRLSNELLEKKLKSHPTDLDEDKLRLRQIELLENVEKRVDIGLANNKEFWKKV